MTWQTDVLDRLNFLRNIPADDPNPINETVNAKMNTINSLLAEEWNYNACLDVNHNTILHLAAQLPNKYLAYNLTNKLLETRQYILNQPNSAGLTAEAMIKANFPITYETLTNYVPDDADEKCQWQNLIAVYQQLHRQGVTISNVEAHCLAVMSFFSKVEDFVYWVKNFRDIANLRFPTLPQGLNYPYEVMGGNMLIHTIAYLKNAYVEADGTWQDRQVEDIKKMILTLQEAGCHINTLSPDNFTATHIAATNIDIHPQGEDVDGDPYESEHFFSYSFKAFAEVRGDLKDDVVTLYELCVGSFYDFSEDDDDLNDELFTLRNHIEIMLSFGGNLYSPIYGTTPRHALDEAEHFNNSDYAVIERDYLVGYHCGAEEVLKRFDKIFRDEGVEGLLKVMNARKPSPAFGVGIAAGAAASAAPGIAAGAAASAPAVASIPNPFLSITPLDPAAAAAPSSSLPTWHLLGGAAAGVPAAVPTAGVPSSSLPTWHLLGGAAAGVPAAVPTAGVPSYSSPIAAGQSFTSRVTDDRKDQDDPQAPRRASKRGRGE